MRTLLSLLALCVCAVGLAEAGTRTIYINNQCSQTLWAATNKLPNSDYNGWVLNAGQTTSFTVPDNWDSGRLWARTGCATNSAGHLQCATGDCPLPASMYTPNNNGLYCGIIGGVPPASVVEWTLGGSGVDYYDLSQVDGYNLPVSVSPTGPYSSVNNPALGKFNCGSPVIHPMSPSQCPEEMRKLDSAGNFIACWSPCKAWHDPEQTRRFPVIKTWDESLICCNCGSACGDSCGCGTPGCAHGCSWLDQNPAHANMRCFVDQWPRSSMGTAFPTVFKAVSPDAYSWQFDDEQSTYQCLNADYTVTFCPNTPSNYCPNIQQVRGFDFPNSDIRSFSTSSSTDCFNACNSQQGCAGVVFHDNTCWLKSAAAFVATNQNAYAGALVGKCNGGLGSGHCQNWAQQTDVDYPDNDLYSVSVTSMDACYKSCDFEPACVGAVFHDNTCWLKTAAAFATTNRVARSGSVAGKCGGFNQHCANWVQLDAMDYPGSDIASQAGVSSAADCHALCAANSNCAVSVLNAGTCWLKSTNAFANPQYCAQCAAAYCKEYPHCANYAAAANTDNGVPADDIGSAPAADVATCAQQCAAVDTCVAAAFANGVCYLKKASALAVVKAAPGVTAITCK